MILPQEVYSNPLNFLTAGLLLNASLAEAKIVRTPMNTAAGTEQHAEIKAENRHS